MPCQMAGLNKVTEAMLLIREQALARGGLEEDAAWKPRCHGGHGAMSNGGLEEDRGNAAAPRGGVAQGQAQRRQRQCCCCKGAPMARGLKEDRGIIMLLLREKAEVRLHGGHGAMPDAGLKEDRGNAAAP